MDEASLRKRAAALDDAALAEIYDRYASKIYSYVYHRTGDSSAAEEITGDVFVRMLEAVQSERAWTTTLQGWLYRIAHNLVVDYFRRQALREGPQLDERWMAREDFHQSFDGLFSSDQLRNAMRFLTEEQKQVVVLKFAEGLSNSEVAEVMGKTEGAIKGLQHRGLEAIRRMIGVPIEA